MNCENFIDFEAEAAALLVRLGVPSALVQQAAEELDDLHQSMAADFAGRLAANVVQRLSPTEAEVATLLAQDLPSKEIAERLGMSPKTVDVHKRSVRQKTGCVTTIGAVVRLMGAPKDFPKVTTSRETSHFPA